MINAIYKNKYKNPVILKNCTLFLELDHYDIEEAVFLKEKKVVKKIHDGWMSGQVDLYSYYKGYVIGNLPASFILDAHLLNSNISLIGYNKNGARLYIPDLTLTGSLKSTFHEFKTHSEIKELK
ncbi:hypothetical protein [Bacillus haynesii]|uniref:hypothetical protein n=1 Tax=Bacillus haynesii TaxID=1925021 RepID=UPI0022810360|nr:hypothetical protein [Bacillus haynesii]MCY9156278.1 hypothetical protein [Bacillus haynesii]